jgi:hypothetical protein
MKACRGGSSGRGCCTSRATGNSEAPHVSSQYLNHDTAAAGEGHVDKEVSASTPGSGSATPLAVGTSGIKMVPLKIGIGVFQRLSSEAVAHNLPLGAFSAPPTANDTINVFDQAEDDEPAALPSKSRYSPYVQRK